MSDSDYDSECSDEDLHHYEDSGIISISDTNEQVAIITTTSLLGFGSIALVIPMITKKPSIYVFAMFVTRSTAEWKV